MGGRSWARRVAFTNLGASVQAVVIWRKSVAHLNTMPGESQLPSLQNFFWQAQIGGKESHTLNFISIGARGIAALGTAAVTLRCIQSSCRAETAAHLWPHY